MALPAKDIEPDEQAGSRNATGDRRDNQELPAANCALCCLSLALLLLHILAALLLMAIALLLLVVHISAPVRLGGWHDGCVDKFHNDKGSRRARHRCPRRWVPDSSPGGRLPSSIVPTGNTH